jgi:CubicO group peptidase (beta-lactamase class C family)
MGTFSSAFQAAATRHQIPAAVAIAVAANQTLQTATHGPVDEDSIFAIASMTKAITTVAALQLVDRGRLSLDERVFENLPVLEGFDAANKPVFSLERFNVTLRQLLTHTAGFAYSWNHPMVYRYGPIDRPFLLHPPGSRWHYGINVDHVGQLIETVSGQTLEDYFQQHIFRPLGMTETSFLLPPGKLSRLAHNFQREPGGTLRQLPRVQPPPPPSFNGGGGLFSTARDYARFLQMFLANGHPVLSPASLTAMASNQTGSLPAGRIKSFVPERSLDIDLIPNVPVCFGLGFVINTEPGPHGRVAGSLAWGGIRNTFYWIDPANGIAAVLLMQFQPFCDPAAMAMLYDLERLVYQSL